MLIKPKPQVHMDTVSKYLLNRFNHEISPLICLKWLDVITRYMCPFWQHKLIPASYSGFEMSDREIVLVSKQVFMFTCVWVISDYQNLHNQQLTSEPGLRLL